MQWPSSPFLHSLSPLFPSLIPSPSVHHINLAEAKDEAPQPLRWETTTQTELPNLPCHLSSASPPCPSSMLWTDKLHGLNLNFYNSKEGAHLDAELLSLPFPSFPLSSIPLCIVKEHQPDFAPTSPSPLQLVLTLPGADVNNTLIPALDWEGTSSSSPSSFSSLLTFNDGSLHSPCPELDPAFDSLESVLIKTNDWLASERAHWVCSPVEKNHESGTGGAEYGEKDKNSAGDDEDGQGLVWVRHWE